MTHLLDTSAILAHFLDEPGADEIESLHAQGPNVVALAAPSWVELETKLRELVSEVDVRENVFLPYTTSLTTLIPVNAESCIAAIRLRNAAPGRLPLVDALIAGVANAASLILVHLRFGNMRRKEFHRFLASVWPQVESLLPAHKLVCVYADHIEAFS